MKKIFACLAMVSAPLGISALTASVPNVVAIILMLLGIGDPVVIWGIAVAVGGYLIPFLFGVPAPISLTIAN